jgi:nucleoid-associated protein YgaU
VSSYYKKINGRNYDKAMLDIAGKSVKGKGDGRISLADSRSIVKQISDGGKITDIEKRTLNYILENYTLTETALKHIEKSLADFLEPEMKRDTKSVKTDTAAEAVYETGEKAVPEKKGNKIFVILVLILLAIFALFAFFKYFYKGNLTDNVVPDKKEDAAVHVQEQTPISEAGKTEIFPGADKTEPVTVKPLAGNEYLVKENDTLILISEALYGDYKKWQDIYKLNKDKIANPTILYPGQVLLLPEK